MSAPVSSLPVHKAKTARVYRAYELLIGIGGLLGAACAVAAVVLHLANG